MKKAQKTYFLSAYNDEGKPNIKLLNPKGNQSGVYFVKNNAGEIVYVGYSESNLYKTIYRHFQSWNDKTQRRATFPKSYKVRIIFTTPKRAALLEKYLISKFKPKDNDLIPEDLTPRQEKEAEGILNDITIVYNNLPDEDYNF